jgi:MFS family permease
MKLRKELLTIAIAEILVAISMGLVGPFYSLYFTKITQNLSDVGLLIGIYWIFVGIIEILVGHLAKKIGRNKMFLIGGILNSICVFLYPFVENFQILVLIEIVGAISYAMQIPAFYTILAEITSEESRTKEVAFVDSVQNIFYGISAIAAGAIISLFGFSLIFGLASVLNLSSSIIVGKRIKS